MSKKIVFMGTPAFAAESLQALIDSGFEIGAVVTVADKPAGRGQQLSESEVKKTAQKAGLKILQPTNLKSDEFLDELHRINADLFVVVAFRMLPEAVWQMPRLGTINLHASLLPDYRGAAPINRAVMNGEKTTGLTTFFIEKEIDTGKIIDRTEIEIGENETAGELHDRMMRIGADLLARTCENIFSGKAAAIPQTDFIKQKKEIKLAPKIFKEDCRIDFKKDIDEIHDFIRGLSPYPGAFTELIDLSNQKTLGLKIFSTRKIHEKHQSEAGKILSDGKKRMKIAVSGGFIDILEVQAPGKRKMKISEFLNGVKIENFKIP